MGWDALAAIMVKGSGVVSGHNELTIASQQAKKRLLTPSLVVISPLALPCTI